MTTPAHGELTVSSPTRLLAGMAFLDARVVLERTLPFTLLEYHQVTRIGQRSLEV